MKGTLVALVVLSSLLFVQGQVLYYVTTLWDSSLSHSASSLNVLDLKTLRNTTLLTYPGGTANTGGVAIGLAATSTQLFWADQTLQQVSCYAASFCLLILLVFFFFFLLFFNMKVFSSSKT